MERKKGKENVGIGRYALTAKTTGDGNIGIGYNALGQTTTGGNNVALGYTAMLLNKTGSNNIALGIDALAHEAALRNHLYTLAIPGSGLAAVAPATNRGLAERILEQGGGLLSELSPETGAAKWTFPSRNRILAGLCKGTLLVEAGEKSGTLITARMTVDYNRELLAIPGSIFSHNSYGTHQFLKLGATMVTEPTDILYALGIEPVKLTAKITEITLTPNEKLVITILSEPRDKDTLLRQLTLPVSEANILLMNMEMQGYIAYDSPHYRSLI